MASHLYPHTSRIDIQIPSDVVMQYIYGRCDHCLEVVNFSPEYLNAVLMTSNAVG